MLFKFFLKPVTYKVNNSRRDAVNNRRDNEQPKSEAYTSQRIQILYNFFCMYPHNYLYIDYNIDRSRSFGVNESSSKLCV